MNTWTIEWDLRLPKEEVINLLHRVIKSPKQAEQIQNALDGKISGDSFELHAERSLVWGIAFRKEIQGSGSVTEQNSGSHMTAHFEVCFPYRYVNLNRKNVSILIPIFILSWVGLIYVQVFAKHLLFLDYLLMPAFFVTGAILLIGFRMYFVIDDKFKEVRNLFTNTFTRYRLEKADNE
jgi:hypothetical protein